MDESLTSLLHKYMPNKHANQMQGRRQGGGLRGLHPPTQKKKEEKRERRRREKERRNRNQKRTEVEPVIPRTCDICGHGPLVAPRPPGGLETPNCNGVSISLPPLSQNPVYAPAKLSIQWSSQGGQLPPPWKRSCHCLHPFLSSITSFQSWSFPKFSWSFDPFLYDVILQITR